MGNILNTQSKNINYIEEIDNYLKLYPTQIINTETTPNKTQFIDNNKDFKDIATDIVTNNILSSEDSMYNFLYTVYEIYSNSIKYYTDKFNINQADILFVYKGGNILRILSQDFMREMPEYSYRNIYEYYMKYIKRSDSDFAIYINPDIPNYDIVYSHITIISYILQKNIRNIFNNNLDYFFDFYKYNKEYKQKTMAKWLDIFTNAECLKDPKNIYYNNIVLGLKFNNITVSNKYNYICPTSNKNENTDGYEELYNNNITYTNSEDISIQLNKTLDFIQVNDRAKFNLIRSKFIFGIVLYNSINNKTYIKDIGGELIDVSIPHKTDFLLTHFFSGKNTQLYNLTYKDMQINFLSYTYQYTISDIEYILYRTKIYPWLIKKYEKRLNRLFLLYFIDLSIKINKNDNKIKVFSRLENDVFISIKTYSVDLINDIIHNIDIFVQTYKKYNLYIENLLIKIKDILKESDFENNLSYYDTMIEILLNNCKVILNSIKNVDTYCSTNTLSPTNLYNSNFKYSLMGGSAIKNNENVENIEKLL